MSRPVQVALLLSILLTGWPGLSSVTAQPLDPSEFPPLKHQSLAELGKLYQSLDLPLPPKEAGFAVLGRGLLPWQTDRYNPNPPDPLRSVHRYHFAIADSEFKGSYRVWSGFDVDQAKRIEQFQQTAPSPERVLEVMKMNRLNPDTYFNQTSNLELIFAIQCHLLEHKDLAAFFYRRCQKTARLPFEETLLIEAWNHWTRQITKPAMDRTFVARRLKVLVGKHDVLNVISTKLYGETPGGRRGIYDLHQALLDQLDLTIKPTTAKPGTAEWLIDEMANERDPSNSSNSFSAGRDFWKRSDQIKSRRQQLESADRRRLLELERQLVKLGFDAIPAMIEHVDDQRLTSSYGVFMGGGIGGQPFRTVCTRHFLTIGWRIRYILLTFFDLTMESENGGWKAKKADYLAAWNRISAMKEPDFVTKKIAKPREVNSFLISFIKDKYPGKTIDLYKAILTSGDDVDYFGDLVFFIVDSNLAPSQKIELLTRGLKHRSIHFQVNALEGLLEIDDVVFTKHCLAWLSRSSKEFTTIENLGCYEMILRLGLCSEDPAARQVIFTTAKSLPLPVKIKILAELPIGTYLPSKNVALSFLAQFLDDPAVFDKNSGNPLNALISGAYGFQKIELRNYAANQILELLNIDLFLDDKTTEAEWAKVRSFVQDEIDRCRELEKAR